MYSYTFVQWVFFFYFYCFFGWCFESAYVSLKKRRLVNRGFIRGPLLPLYGSGAIMMLVVSMPFQDSLILTYIAGCIGATVLEYVTGVTMEALFKVRYWDYSNQKFNFQGHICLGSTLAWGGLTILMTHVIHRPIEQLVFSIPGGILTGVTFVITCAFAADFAVSFKAALDLRDVLMKMEQAREELERMQRRLDVIAAVADEAFTNARKESKERLDDLQERLSEKQEKIQERLAERQEEIQNRFAERQEEIQNRLAEHYEDLQDKREENRIRRDVMVKQVEEGLARAKETLLNRELSGERREELLELGTKIRLNLENHEKKQFLKDMVKRSMLKGNPGMVSKKFREALEELKEAAEKRDKK